MSTVSRKKSSLQYINLFLFCVQEWPFQRDWALGTKLLPVFILLKKSSFVIPPVSPKDSKDHVNTIYSWPMPCVANIDPLKNWQILWEKNSIFVHNQLFTKFFSYICTVHFLKIAFQQMSSNLVQYAQAHDSRFRYWIGMANRNLLHSA